MMEDSTQRKVLQIIQEKDNEISKLRTENEDIRKIENDIESKLKQTEMLLEAHEIANRQRDDNQEIDRLENQVEEMKETIDHQKDEIVTMAENLRSTQKQCGIELGKLENVVEKKDSIISSLREEIISLRAANTKMNLEKREQTQKISVQKNEIRVLSDRIRNHQSRDLDEIFEKLKTEEPSMKEENLQNENNQLKSNIESTKRENERLRQIIEESKTKNSFLKKKLNEKEEEVKNEKIDRKNKHDEYRSEILKLQNSNEQNIGYIEKLKNTVQEKNDQLNHVNQLFSQTKDRSVVILNTKFSNCLAVQYGIKEKLMESQQDQQRLKVKNQCVMNELGLKSKYVFELEAKLEQHEETRTEHEKRIDEMNDLNRDLEKKNMDQQNELSHVRSVERETKDKNKQLYFQIVKLQESVHKRDQTVSKNSISNIKQIQRDVLKKVGLPKNMTLKDLLSQTRQLNQKLESIASSKSGGGSNMTTKRFNLLKKEVGLLLPMFEDKLVRMIQNWQKSVFQKHRTSWELERSQSKYLHLQKVLESLVVEKATLMKSVQSWKKKCNNLQSRELSLMKKDKEAAERKNIMLSQRYETMKLETLKLANSLVQKTAEKAMAMEDLAELERDREAEKKLQAEQLASLRASLEETRERGRGKMRTFWTEELKKLEYSSDTEKIEHLSNQVYALKSLETAMREKELLNETLIHTLQNRIEMMETSLHKLDQRAKDSRILPKISDFVVESNKGYQNERVKELQVEVHTLKEELEKAKMQNVMKKYQDRTSTITTSTIHPPNFSQSQSKFEVIDEDFNNINCTKEESQSEEENRILKKLTIENGDLVSRLTLQKLEIDELQNQVQEKEVEIGLLRKYFTSTSSKKKKMKKKVGKSKRRATSPTPSSSLDTNHGNQERIAKQLSGAIKQQSVTQRKLIRSLNQEINLRNQIIERDRRIKELRSSLESLVHHRSSSKNKKGKKLDGSETLSSKQLSTPQKKEIIELKSEINYLHKKLNEESLKNAQQHEEIGKRSYHQEYPNPNQQQQQEQEEEEEKQQQLLEDEMAKKEELIRKLETEKASTQIEKDEVVEKLQILEDQYVRIKESHSKQKRVITKLTLKMNEEATRLKESEKVISELHQHRDTLNTQVSDLKKMMEEKNLKIDHKVLERNDTLTQTMNNLRKEQLNIQKLMQVITNLRKRNDTLLEYKKININLKQRIDDLEDQVDDKRTNTDETESKLKDAKDFIQVLRTERFRIQEDYRVKMSKLKKDFSTFKSMQQKASEEHLLIIESLEQEIETCKREKHDLQNTQTTKLEEYEMKMKEQEEKHDVLMKETQLTSQQIQNQLMEEKSNLLSQYQERNEEYQRLVAEKCCLEKELKEFKGQFHEFKVHQESIFHEYTQNTKQLQSRLAMASQKERKRGLKKREAEKLQKKSNLLERSVRMKETELEKEVSKNREWKARVMSLQKKHREEKKLMRQMIEKLKKSSHTEEEWRMISDSLKTAKKALKDTVYENQRKAEMISQMKSNFNQEIEKLETSISDHKRHSDQFREVLKEKNRRNQILKDYKSKIEELKKKIKAQSTRLTSLRGKVKDLAHENTRKEQYIKNLQMIISKKEEFGEELKSDVHKNRSEISKKESKIKQLTTRIERVTQEERLKTQDRDNAIHELKKCVLEIGSRQVRKIKKLEEKVIRCEQMMEEEIEDNNNNNNKQMTNHLLQKLTDEEEEEEDIISMASSMATSDMIDISSSSASSFASPGIRKSNNNNNNRNQSIISHRDIGLSLDEMADIMSSTRKVRGRKVHKKKNRKKKNKKKNKKRKKNQLILSDEDSDDSDDEEEEIEHPKTEKAQQIFNKIKGVLTSEKDPQHPLPTDTIDCKDQIEVLVNMRIGLEKSKLILEKKQFFGNPEDNRGGMMNPFDNQGSLVFGNNNNNSGVGYSKKKFDLQRENLKLKNDVEKMKEKEIIYENTVNALEKQLLQE